jgi:Tfp pilus assembly protein FimT
MAPRCRTTSRAFTLIELVLVMGIITLMVTIIAPSLSAFATGRKTQYAASQLISMAKYARSQAINEGRTYRMTLDTSKRTASLTVQNVGQFVEPSSSLGNRIDLAEGLTLRTDLTPQPDGGTYVDFHSDGRTGDGPMHVWVTDKQGRVMELACLSPTELFHVLPPEEMTK